MLSPSETSGEVSKTGSSCPIEADANDEMAQRRFRITVNGLVDAVRDEMLMQRLKSKIKELRQIRTVSWT